VPCKQYQHDEGRYTFEPYAGKVVGMRNANSAWPHSPWDAVIVEYDEGDMQEACPWECMLHLEESSDTHRVRAACPVAHMDSAEVQRIQEEMEALLGGPDADLYSPFEFEVDPAAFPQYYDQIALPMYTDLIRRRLGSGYYRQGAALEHDVQQLYLNCVTFNGDESEIAVAGRRLRDQLLRIIRPSRDGDGSCSGSGTGTGTGAGAGTGTYREVVTVRLA